MGWLALDFPAGGNQFPLFISVCVVVLGSLMVVKTALRPARYRRRVDAGLSRDAWRPLAVLAFAILYVLAILHLGYYVSTAAFLLLVPIYAGFNRPVPVAGAAAMCIAFIYGLFGFALQVNLPSGMLF